MFAEPPAQLWDGCLVEIHGLDAPLQASEVTRQTNPFAEPVDANGRRGRVVGWSAEDRKYVVETFDGLILGVAEENFRSFEPDGAEDGGFDLVWPAEDLEAEVFSQEVVELLRRKGWCLVQMFTEESTRGEAVDVAMELVDWRLPKLDLEVQYMGHSNTTKYCELDPDDLARECEDALAQCDRCLTHLGVALAPFAAQHLGFSVWGRHNGQVRMPFRSSEEQFLRPSNLSDDDYEPGGKVYNHLDFLERRRLQALFMVENDGGEVQLYPGPRSGLEQRTVQIPLSRGKLLLFQSDLMSYSYQPRGERSVLLQTWYVTEPSFPDLADTRVVELPAGQHGDRVMVTTLQMRFPGMSHSPEGCWNMWVSGTDTAITLPSTRFDVDEYYKADGTGLLYTNHFAGLAEEFMTGFDYEFFNIDRHEAEGMSPEQANVLEVGFATLAAAGFTRKSLRGQRVGVYLGDAGTDWKVCIAGKRVMDYATKGLEINPHMYTGWQIGICCSRLSHLMDMQGPCVSVDTACSSSLVALGQASRSLVKPSGSQASPGADAHLSRALVMGLCLDDGAGTFVAYCAATMLSTSGRSFTFDESANGFLRGEGCGGAFLEISANDEDAQAMMACVIGSNVNQDGRSASMTAPNGPSQQMCIKASMMEAGLRPSEITIAECHGTGTALGDPIEVGALRDVMKDRGEDPIIMTSGKANFGHMEASAGMAGVTKCILMLLGMTGAANVHLKLINPHIEFVGYPALFVSEHADGGARTGISGVSSFGVGGTNARGDLWGRSKFGHLTTTEVNTQQKLERKGVTYARVRANGQPGPGVTDKIYLVGSWDRWSSMEEMVPERAGEFAATIRLGDTRLERFRIVLNQDAKQSLYPAEDFGDASAEILGPDWHDEGRSWTIDGREDGGRPGDAYRIKLEWDFSWDVGEHRRITWELQPQLEAPPVEAKSVDHRYFIRGSWASWRLCPMSLAAGSTSTFRATARIGLSGQEEFQFVRDRDEAQVIHPAVEKASSLSVPVQGPDAAGRGKHWAIRGPTGEVVALELRLTDGCIEVSATSPTVGRKTWRSEDSSRRSRALEDR